MIKTLAIIMSLLTASYAFAEEKGIEVGKHVNANVDVLSMILSLCVVLALIIVSAFVLKKFQVTQTQLNGMKVIASLSLGTKERLIVVEVAQEQLLLGVSANNINYIKTLEKPLTAQEFKSPDFAQSFAKVFKGKQG